MILSGPVCPAVGAHGFVLVSRRRSSSRKMKYRRKNTAKQADASAGAGRRPGPGHSVRRRASFWRMTGNMNECPPGFRLFSRGSYSMGRSKHNILGSLLAWGSSEIVDSVACCDVSYLFAVIRSCVCYVRRLLEATARWAALSSLFLRYYIKVPYFILAKGSPHEGGNMINKVLATSLRYVGETERQRLGSLSEGGGWCGWRPSSSSNFSARAFELVLFIEIGRAVPCRAIRGKSISFNSTLPPS